MRKGREPNSFSKKEHLKKSDSIRDVFDKGVPFRGRLINIYLLKRNAGPRINRVAFIARKHLYNNKLVLRNRFRRILREAYRKTKHLLPADYDIVILATHVTTHTTSSLIEKEIAYVFKKRVKK